MRPAGERIFTIDGLDDDRAQTARQPLVSLPQPIGFRSDLAGFARSAPASPALTRSAASVSSAAFSYLLTDGDPREVMAAIAQLDAAPSRFGRVDPSLHEIFVERVGNAANPQRRPEVAHV